jgi:hypothetical protein
MIVPMMRLTDNSQLLDPGMTPSPVEEPQIIFRRDARDRFDDSLRYGNMNKAEMLLRLGVPGVWETWPFTAWEPRRFPVAEDKGKFVPAGWVARLSPQASKEVEAGGRVRRISRFGSIAIMSAGLDVRVIRRAAPALTCYAPWLADVGRDGPVARVVVDRAKGYLAAPISTVTDKPAFPQGAGRNDYVSIARYEREQVGGAWVVRDGVEHPAAARGTPEAAAFDRYRLQDMIDAVTALALGAHLSGDGALGTRAAEHVRAWFLDPVSRMNPNMRFAQIVPNGPADNNGRGVVDFRDFWALGDALRLLARIGALNVEEEAQLKGWFRAFLGDLSNRGGLVGNGSNIGVWHDVLFASVAAYADELAALGAILSRAPLRIHRQIHPWGAQPAEVGRAAPLHYGLFGLQAMIALAWIGRSYGLDLWKYAGANHRSIPMAARFIALNRTLFSDYAAAGARFDNRIEAAMRCIPDDAADAGVLADVERRAAVATDALTGDDGFPPLWGLFVAAGGVKTAASP